MAETDYTSALDTITLALQNGYDQDSSIRDSVLSAISEQGAKIDTTNLQIGNMHDAIQGLSPKLDAIAAAITPNSEVIDYGDKLDQLTQLLAYTDLLLIVCIVVAFLIGGMVFGRSVFDRLRTRDA